MVVVINPERARYRLVLLDFVNEAIGGNVKQPRSTTLNPFALSIIPPGSSRCRACRPHRSQNHGPFLLSLLSSSDEGLGWRISTPRS
jgi:hypothetical protein